MLLSICLWLECHLLITHCKDTVPKFETNIPRNETVRPRSQFLHSWEFPTSWEYINRSQIQECGNWERGRAQFHFWEYINLPLCNHLFLHHFFPPVLSSEKWINYRAPWVSSVLLFIGGVHIGARVLLYPTLILVWLYHSHIPVGRRGVIYLCKWFLLRD